MWANLWRPHARTALQQRQRKGRRRRRRCAVASSEESLLPNAPRARPRGALAIWAAPGEVENNSCAVSGSRTQAQPLFISFLSFLLSPLSLGSRGFITFNDLNSHAPSSYLPYLIWDSAGLLVPLNTQRLIDLRERDELVGAGSVNSELMWEDGHVAGGLILCFSEVRVASKCVSFYFAESPVIRPPAVQAAPCPGTGRWLPLR